MKTIDGKITKKHVDQIKERIEKSTVEPANVPCTKTREEGKIREIANNTTTSVGCNATKIVPIYPTRDEEQKNVIQPTPVIDNELKTEPIILRRSTRIRNVSNRLDL